MIRPARAEEAGSVRALVRDAYERWIARLGREPSPMNDDYAKRIADGQAWVLDVGGEILGVVMLRDGPEALMMPNIAVVSAAQGKGYGRRLIEFAEAEAMRRGYDEVRLSVNARMVENVSLYQHLGFVEIGRTQGESADRVYLRMAKRVTS